LPTFRRVGHVEVLTFRFVEGQTFLRKEDLAMVRKLCLLAALLFATSMLSGCVVEPGYYHHGGWGWHHDRY
jgi:hypothetical protein